MNDTVTLPTSCAVAVARCDDTATSPDLAWLVVPLVIISVLVILAIVYFGIRGGRGR